MQTRGRNVNPSLLSGFRFSLVWKRQADPRVGRGEVLGEMFAVWCNDSTEASPVFVECNQQIEGDGVKLPQINNHFGQPMAPTCRQEVPAINARRPNGSPNFRRFQN